MLAWVFWHTRFEDVTEDEYNRNLRAFHARIAAAAPEGFLGSRTLAYDALPWLPSATEVYEDWYFVRDSSALDRLDEAALAAFTHDAHERIARLAANAVAGLYRLRAGSPLPHPSHCSWISKPRGQSYETFIAGIVDAGAIWSRKMVLGPTPEFCIESDHKPRLPVPSMTMPTRTPANA